MGEFFKGLRRKAGCVALVMACALMVGWLRSWVVFDELRFMTGAHGQWFYSEHGSCHWDYEWPKNGADISHVFNSGFESRELDINHSKYVAFGYFRGRDNLNRGEYFSVTFSYGVVAIPLTLLSAYLILWKPRTKPD